MISDMDFVFYFTILCFILIFSSLIYFVDFDFKLVDLFKRQSENELSIKDKIINAYLGVKERLRHRPSRTEIFLYMDEEILLAMRKNAKFNILRDYMSFLNEQKELTDEEFYPMQLLIYSTYKFPHCIIDIEKVKNNVTELANLLRNKKEELRNLKKEIGTLEKSLYKAMKQK